MALVGSNGAGKTTLLRALSRVIGATGRILFDGQELAALTPERVFGLGLVQVPEGRQLFDHMTVDENLLMGAYRRRDQAGVDAQLRARLCAVSRSCASAAPAAPAACRAASSRCARSRAR